MSILTDSAPDEVMAVAASYDASGRYGAQTPFSDQLSGHWEGALWQVDATHNSMITVGNGGRKDTRAQLTFRYDTERGSATYVVERPLAKDEQMFLDLSDLIRLQIPDVKGHTIPSTVTTGSYSLADLDDHGMGNLFEGKVVTDKRSGDATYGCMVCCGHRPPASMNPNPLDIWIAGTGSVALMSRNACTSQLEDMTDYYDTWWSDNTGILTAAYAELTGVSAGSANGWASGTYPYPSVTEDSPDGCPTEAVQGQGPTNVQVPTYFDMTGADPLIDADCALGTGGAGAVPHYQVLDQNGLPMQQSGMTPQEDVSRDGVDWGRGFLPFATPQQTRANGTFDDNPVGSCFGPPIPSTNVCVTAVQHFNIVLGGRTFPINTVVTSRDCVKGISGSATGNPAGHNGSYSFGTVN